LDIRSETSLTYNYILAFVLSEGTGKFEQLQRFFQCNGLDGHFFFYLGETGLFLIFGSTYLCYWAETSDFYRHLLSADGVCSQNPFACLVGGFRGKCVFY